MSKPQLPSRRRRPSHEPQARLHALPEVLPLRSYRPLLHGGDAGDQRGQAGPLRIQHQPDFKEMAEALGADKYQVNDC